jgi:Ca2+-transporting ATPase
MKPTAESHVRPIDEDSPVEADSYPGEPVPIARRGRTVSEATTVRPTSPPTNMIAPSLHSRSSSMATAIVPPVDASEALRPDPGTESAFQVIDNPFAFSPGQLNKLLNPKSLDAFRALGGLRGIERGLQTNITSGLSIDETSAAHRISFETAVVGDSQKSASKLPENRSSGSGSFSDRSRVFGSNVLPSKKATPLWKVSFAKSNSLR